VLEVSHRSAVQLSHQDPAQTLVDGKHVRNEVRMVLRQGIRQRRLVLEDREHGLQVDATAVGLESQDGRDRPLLDDLHRPAAA
jgi:hypothetical protein